MFSPADPATPFWKGRTDRNGWVAFVPDAPGRWRVRVVDATGHGIVATVDVPAPGASRARIGISSARVPAGVPGPSPGRRGARRRHLRIPLLLGATEGPLTGPPGATMHVPDGFLSPAITLPAWGAAAPLWYWAVRRNFGASATESLPVVGSLTALAFVVQGIMIPVPGGTSAHLTGVAILAILYNPGVAFVCESLVLLLQALFFGAGGFTVLGVNALAMGLLGPGAAWLAYRALRGLSGARRRLRGRLRRHAGGHAGGGARARAAAPARPGLHAGALRGDRPSP